MFQNQLEMTATLSFGCANHWQQGLQEARCSVNVLSQQLQSHPLSPPRTQALYRGQDPVPCPSVAQVATPRVGLSQVPRN